MKILELRCKKCKLEFTRLVKENDEIKNEKCKKCKGDVEIINEVYLGEMGCGSCDGCQSGCGAQSKAKNKISD